MFFLYFNYIFVLYLTSQITSAPYTAYIESMTSLPLLTSLSLDLNLWQLCRFSLKVYCQVWKKLLGWLFGFGFGFFSLLCSLNQEARAVSDPLLKWSKSIPFYMHIYFYWHGLGWKESQDNQGSGADFLVLCQDGLEIWSGSNTKTAKQIALTFQVFPLEIITLSGDSLSPNIFLLLGAIWKSSAQVVQRGQSKF